MPKKFERSTKANKVTENSRGRVIVAISRRHPSGAYVKGNVNKYCTVKDAKVTEVFEAIEKALFD